MRHCYHGVNSNRLSSILSKSLCGVLVKLLDLQARGRGFDSGLLQYFEWDFKPKPRLRVTLADDGT